MLRNLLEGHLLRAIHDRADHDAFPLVMGAVALASTLSMSIPFGGLLVSGVLMAPRRWVAIAMISAVGASLGASALYLVFHHLGWSRFFESYPEIVRSIAWRDATGWLNQYGTISLLVIAASPLPMTPALIFAAISRLPVVEVIGALWVGKSIKYMAYAWSASYLPAFLLHQGWQPLRRLGARLASSSPPTPPPSQVKD